MDNYNYEWGSLVEDLDLIELDYNVDLESFSLEQEEVYG